MCRAGDADHNQFGLSAIGEHGLWWVRQNLVRDVAALNKTEMLPWDSWGAAVGMHNDSPPDELSALDHAADVTAHEVNFEQVRELYDDGRFHVPETIQSFNAAFATPVGGDLGAGRLTASNGRKRPLRPPAQILPRPA